MKISVLTMNFSHNCLGRAWLLADILSRNYDVEIVGPMKGEGIWEPLEETDIEYKSVPVNGFPYYIPQVNELLGKIEGNVVYASKPRFWSFDIGLMKKFFSDRSLVLDIDDWERGFKLAGGERQELLKGWGRIRSHLGNFKSSILHPTDSYTAFLANEKLVRFADEITVSNSFLKDRFGGKIIWHARDASVFNPEHYDKLSLREKYGIPKEENVVLFSGTPRRHKGIEDLIEALSNSSEGYLCLVGLDKDNDYHKELIDMLQEKVGVERSIWFGRQPFSAIPEFLALSDLVVIPQREDYSTVGQMPAKVFDAMTMAKPIITTEVSDLKYVIGGGGWVVPPGKPSELKDAIKYALEHPGEAEKKGKQARERLKKYFSYKAMKKKLKEIFEPYKSNE